jgi:serine/threonine protein kinase
MGELLGSGAFGHVYRARWHGSEVAVKTFGVLPMQPDVTSGFSAIVDAAARTGSATTLASRTTAVSASFELELKILLSLRHPNICALYGSLQSPPLLVMELGVGGSLADLLARGSTSMASLPWRTRLSIGAGTACGIDFLHMQRPPVVHRDLKSANVVLSADLVPKVCDFGLSVIFPIVRRRSAEMQRDATTGGADAGGTIRGTPKYMAPEVVMSARISDPCAIDIYGLGVILHDLSHLGVGGAGGGGGGGGAGGASMEVSQAPGSSAGTGSALSANGTTWTPRGPAGAGGGANIAQVLFQRAHAGFAVHIGAHVPPPLTRVIAACLAVEPAGRPRSTGVRTELLALAARPSLDWAAAADNEGGGGGGAAAAAAAASD